ncbi:unnamed protein product [Lactuca saligna]|uniref:Uncharacterized protein n=1 Tax=Lactuca saligna TaxID=75948 RepID=A0AA35ZP32_LACSI|nr:unnamed protein product [Lactuca saligna]
MYRSIQGLIPPLAIANYDPGMITFLLFTIRCPMKRRVGEITSQTTSIMGSHVCLTGLAKLDDDLKGKQVFHFSCRFTIGVRLLIFEAQRLGAVSKIPPPPMPTGTWGGSWSCWGDKVCDKKKGTASVAAVSPPQAIDPQEGRLR